MSGISESTILFNRELLSSQLFGQQILRLSTLSDIFRSISNSIIPSRYRRFLPHANNQLGHTYQFNFNLVPFQVYRTHHCIDKTTSLCLNVSMIDHSSNENGSFVPVFDVSQEAIQPIGANEATIRLDEVERMNNRTLPGLMSVAGCAMAGVGAYLSYRHNNIAMPIGGFGAGFSAGGYIFSREIIKRRSELRVNDTQDAK